MAKDDREYEEADDLEDLDDLDDEVEESLIADDLAPRVGGAAAFGAGLMLGAILGAGIALLVAPQRGEETRGRISKRLRALRDDAADHIGEWRDDARHELRRQRRRLKRKLNR